MLSFSDTTYFKSLEYKRVSVIATSLLTNHQVMYINNDKIIAYKKETVIDDGQAVV